MSASVVALKNVLLPTFAFPTIPIIIFLVRKSPVLKSLPYATFIYAFVIKNLYGFSATYRESYFSPL